VPYVNKPRPYKKEWKQEQARNEKPARAARARARRKMDAEGVDREGKVIDHIKPLSKGGTNAKSNLRLTTREKNASFARNPDRSVKRNGKK
jgi:5-methylcytosine-specific restriction endonuclease McrA